MQKSLTGAHGVTPSRDPAHGADGSTAPGQSHRLHITVERGRLAQLDQHDVIVNVPGVVVWMADDTGGLDELLSSLVDRNVVLSQTHLQAPKIRRHTQMLPQIFNEYCSCQT